MNHKAKKSEYLKEIEKHLDLLPTSLFESLMALRSQAGAFDLQGSLLQDFLAGDEYFPLIDGLLRFCDELGLTAEFDRKAIVLGSAFNGLALIIHEYIYWCDRRFEKSLLPLSQLFLLKCDYYFQTSFPSDSPFWAVHHKAWQDHAEAILWHQVNHIEQCKPYGEDDWLKIGKRWAPTKAGFLGGLLKTRRLTDLHLLETLFDEMNTLFQIRRDILNIPKDAYRGIHTLAIDRILRFFPNKTSGLDHPEKILGALLLFNPIPELIETCYQRLAICEILGKKLRISVLSTVLTRLSQSFQELRSLFSLKKKQPLDQASDSAKAPESQGFSLFREDDLNESLQMAQDFLLGDPDFRESWEIHRWGFLGQKRLTGRVFPTGFILEMLLASGLDVTDRLHNLFWMWENIDGKYFEEECSLPPDADSLGLMLRLFSFSRSPEVHDRILKTALRRLIVNIANSGNIPTYFKIQPPGEKKTTYFTHIAGNDCGSVKAGLLLGLIQYDYEEYREIIHPLLDHLLQMVAWHGNTVNIYYPSGYWLWLMFRLLDAIKLKRKQTIEVALLEKVMEVLRLKLDLLRKSAHITAQQASWLTLCCEMPEHWKMLSKEWLNILAKSQRHDGSWEGEPLYLVPTKGNLTAWHSSRLLTTSICYSALRIYQKVV